MTLHVLLLEDDPSKKNRLLSFLSEKKELFRQVDTALCTADALRQMREHRYDLLIADVVVPAELGGIKSESNCIAMFDELDDGFDGIQVPKYALAISASSELSKEAHDFFRGRPWNIVPYSDENSESLVTIEKVAGFVLAADKNSSRHSECDVFIIAALMEPEFSAVEALPFNWGALEPLDDLQMVRFGEIKAGDRMLRVAAGFCSRMGPIPAAVLTTKVALKLKPKIIIMAGICAGIPKKSEIGDVIAADISWDWQSGKYVDQMGDEAFEIAPHQIVLDEPSKNQLLLFRRDQNFWSGLAEIALKSGATMPKLVIGPMASGSSVLADARVAERIKKNQHKNVVGLDMEAYGVFSAAAACDPGIRVLVLKAVCDKGDVTKNDIHQAYAAEVSARAVYHFVSNYVTRLI